MKRGLAAMEKSCPRCHRDRPFGQWLCDDCHPTVMAEIGERCSLPGTAVEDDPVDVALAPKPDWWKDEPTIHEIRRLIDHAKNNVPCSGNTPVWKDDPSGASSSWDNAVKICEDHAL